MAAGQAQGKYKVRSGYPSRFEHSVVFNGETIVYISLSFAEAEEIARKLNDVIYADS